MLLTQVLLGLVVVIGCVFIGEATVGVDISQSSTISAFQCLASSGYTFAIIRCYESTGQPDTNGPHSVYNAWDGGMSHVDVYIFPCPTCGDGAGQATAAIQYLQSYNAKWGTVWLDIEGPQYWYSDTGSNQAFFNDLVSGAQSAGATVGVYTSESQWVPIMGDWNGGSSFPLWYAHYDDYQSFNDFSAFGGWSSPSMKQFEGDATLCGLGVDVNWYPDY